MSEIGNEPEKTPQWTFEAKSNRFCLHNVLPARSEFLIPEMFGK